MKTLWGETIQCKLLQSPGPLCLCRDGFVVEVLVGLVGGSDCVLKGLFERVARLCGKRKQVVIGNENLDWT